MCFNARYVLSSSLKRAKRDGRKEDAEYWLALLKKYDATFQFEDLYQISAFAHPKVIIYQNNKPYEPGISQWGLIPDWAKEPEKIWNSTLNARGETIFEKSSFRKSAETKRCLIPVEGFYEHHDYKGKKYPFYISRKDGEVLYLAGIWNDWANPKTGEIINTYSIVTTQANPLMAKIHNKPANSEDKRMPVILSENIMEEWLKPLSKQELQEIALFQFPDSKLEAWTVRRLSGKESLGNVPEVSKKTEYPDLVFDNDQELKLF